MVRAQYRWGPTFLVLTLVLGWLLILIWGQLHAVSVTYLIPFELLGGGLCLLGGLFYHQRSAPSCPMPEDKELASDTSEEESTLQLQYYRHFAAISGQGVMLLSREGVIESLDERACSLLELQSDAELKGEHVSSLYPASLREKIWDTIRAALQSTGGWSGELLLQPTAEACFPMLQHFVTLQSDKGGGQRILSFLFDLQEQKHHELILRNRLSALMSPATEIESVDFHDLFDVEEIQEIQDAFSDAMHVASLITDPDGKPITRPSNFCRLCKDVIRKTKKGKKNCRCSDAILGRPNPDGPIMQVCLSGGLWDGGTSICAGEHHIANWLVGQVRESETSDEDLMAYAYQIGADVDEFREALQEVPIMPREQFALICNGLFLIATQLSKQALRNLQQARSLRAQEIWREEQLNTRNQLEERVSYLEQELRESQERLTAAEHAKSVFLSNMSHEVRTPMNGVLGMTDLLLDTALDSAQYEYARYIKSCGESLLFLLDAVLEYTKITMGEIETESIPFNPRRVVEEVADFASGHAFKKGLEFACLVHDSTPVFVEGDPGRLRQILSNICDNAIKFTEKGEVFVQVRLEEEEAQLLRLRFTIADTGIGIPKEEYEHIFDDFFQVDSSITRQYGGTGLGLALVKRIVEKLGGEIGVQSTVDKGTMFWFIVPYKKTACPSQAAQPVETFTLNVQDVRVLVVDDSATNRLVLREFFRRWKGAIHEAVNGREALEKMHQAYVEKRPYDLVLIDMMMPEMDGETLGRCIKEESVLEETMLVMLTSGDDRGQKERLQQIGFCAYLHKPVRYQQLYTCLARVLGTQSSASTSVPTQNFILKESLLNGGNSRKRILVADDNLVNQRHIMYLLEKLGYRVDAVSNGTEALEALKKLSYDLLFMNSQIPIQDGQNTSQIFQKGEAGKQHIPVIAMMEEEKKVDVERCMKIGMDGFLQKPFTVEKLSSVIAQFFSPEEKNG